VTEAAVIPSFVSFRACDIHIQMGAFSLRFDAMFWPMLPLPDCVCTMPATFRRTILSVVMAVAVKCQPHSTHDFSGPEIDSHSELVGQPE
jgi:hypothetical protein